MRGQIGGLAQAQRNAQDGISLVQTAEGALNEVHSMLQRVRDLKVQFKNGTLSSDDKDAIAAEVSQIAGEVKSISTDTKFNGNSLLGASTFTFQVGANDSETIPRRPSASARRSARPAPAASPSSRASSDVAAAKAALDRGRRARRSVDDRQRDQERLDRPWQPRRGPEPPRASPDNLATYQENLTASESRIRDVDMASEMTKFTKLNILQQAGTSMLAQANQAPQGVLSLLR